MAEFSAKNKKEVKNNSPHIYKRSSQDSHITNVSTSLESLVFGRAKDFEKSLTKKRMVLATTSLLFLVIVGSYFAPKGAAESAMFYPTSCLGGWSNPNKAEGMAETTGEAGGFSYSNSASLAPDTSADLYCGSFKGDVPKSSVPTKMVLTIFWKTLMEAESAPVTGSSFASSTLEILDATSSTSFISDASTTPAIDTVDTSKEISPTEDIIPSTEIIPTTESSQPSTPTPSDPQSYFYQIGKNILSVISTPVYALEDDAIATTTDTQEIATTTESTSVAVVDLHSNALVEVFYTLDGSTWNSLGKVDKDAMSFNTFEVPVTASSTWDDISNIQFKIESVTSFDEKPVILVDGMVLGVEYADAIKKEEIKKADPKSYHITVGTTTGDISADMSVDPSQGENLNVGTPAGGSLLVYKDSTGEVIYSIGLGSSPTPVSSYIFDVGTFTAVVTARSDGCAGIPQRECTLDKDIIGYVKFKVTPTEDTPLEYVHTQ